MMSFHAELAPSPSDTAVPGLAQRRIWKAPDLLSHSLVILTLPRLYLTPMTGAPKSEVLDQLLSVRMVDTFLGPLATIIDLQTVRRVKFELATFAITIDYFTANDPKARTIIRFATAEVADSFFAKLWRRLGDGFQVKTPVPDWWFLARVPLVFIAAMIVFTAVAALGLNALADWGGSKSGMGQLLPDWRTACIIGGGAVAIAQVWLYRLATRPPEQLELVQR